MTVDLIIIEESIKAVYEDLKNGFQSALLDEYQFMEQAHVCSQFLTALSENMRHSGVDTEHLKRITSLRDQLEYPIMQMAFGT